MDIRLRWEEITKAETECPFQGWAGAELLGTVSCGGGGGDLRCQSEEFWSFISCDCCHSQASQVSLVISLPDVPAGENGREKSHQLQALF